MRKRTSILILLFFPAFLASCSYAFLQRIHPDSESASQTGFSKDVNPDAYYHSIRAALYESQDQDEAAMGEYKAALATAPDSLFLLDRLLALLIRTGRLEEAASNAEKALSLDPKHVQGLIQLGGAYVISGDSEKAVAVFDRVLRVAPDQASAYFGMAGARVNLGQFDLAEKAIRKGISIDPTDPLGFFYQGRLMLDQQKYDEAVVAFKKTIELRPSFEAGYLNLGRVFELKGDLDSARAAYQDLLDGVGSDSREALGAMASLLLKQKEYDEALVFLQSWAQRDPNNLDVHLRLAYLYSEKKIYDKAINEISWGVTRNPRDIKLRFYRASLYEESEAFDRAKEEYENIIGIDPDNVDSRLRLASLYFFRTKEPDHALTLAKEAVKLDPKRPDAYIVLGLIHFEMEDYKTATEVFGEGVQMFPKHTELRFRLGTAYDKLHRTEEMIAEMKEVIKVDSQHANSLNYLGYTYAEKGIHLEEALDLIQRAIKVKSDDGYYIDSLGWVYYRMGRYQEALDELKQAISFVPDDPVIHEHLGEAYLKLQMTEKAREEWIRSLELDPKNSALADRFRSTGFGEPLDIESIRKATEQGPPSKPPVEGLAEKNVVPIERSP